MSKNIVLNVKVQYINDIDPFSTSLAYLEPSRPFTHSFELHVPLGDQIPYVHKLLRAPHKVEECTMQIYRPRNDQFTQGRLNPAPSSALGLRQENTDYFGAYLDWDMSLAEQPDELMLLKESSRTMLILRTNICIRVRRIIEKLLCSNGRDLRRALFSLKQIFQDDKDLVHEFVQNDGLSCLIKLGSDSDQSYQNYILRALGQIFLYIDGMNGVIAHNDTIQWLYSLLTSQFRLVVKTALKLLLVFVEYTESNALLFLAAVYIVDKDRNVMVWSKLMYLLNDTENTDQEEIFVYAMTLINKTLSAVPDQDTYYDLVDSLEEQGMQDVLKRMQSLNSKQIKEQIDLYEKMLQKEDESSEYSPSKFITTNGQQSKSSNKNGHNLISGSGKRRRHSGQFFAQQINGYSNGLPLCPENEVFDDFSPEKERKQNFVSNRRSSFNSKSTDLESRDEQSHVKCSPTTQKSPSAASCLSNSVSDRSSASPIAASPIQAAIAVPSQAIAPPPPPPAPYFSVKISPGYSALPNDDVSRAEDKFECASINFDPIRTSVKTLNPLMKTTTLGAVHSLVERLASSSLNQQNSASSVQKVEEAPDQEKEEASEQNENSFAVALSKARNSMTQNRIPPNSDRKSTASTATSSTYAESSFLKKSESELQWEKAAAKVLSQPLVINDLNFCELNDEDDCDPLKVAQTALNLSNAPPLPPMLNGLNAVVAPPIKLVPPPSLPFAPPTSWKKEREENSLQNGGNSNNNMKTVKLFWKEAQVVTTAPVADRESAAKTGVFWQKIQPVDIDTERLVHLFETKSNKDMNTIKKKDEKRAEIRVLDTKRSNAINIGLTKLPNTRTIVQSIYKYDSAVLNKECIEKLLNTMLPTDEELKKISQAKSENEKNTLDLPLGAAEQFLLTLSEIPALRARLKLWLFILDYANLEKEVAEPLMDLKLAIEELEKNRTFQWVMATMLAVGNALNGVKVKGFQLEFLAKAHEVKDTINKNSLVYHVCSIVNEKFGENSSDLYSEMGAIVRCSKIDFDQELLDNLKKLESECKNSWEYLKNIETNGTAAGHCGLYGGQTNFNINKISDNLTDYAQRIMILKVIHRRVFNRFRKFLLFMGSPPHVVKDTEINWICKTVAEFALEYRTCREKMLLQKKRMQEKRERNKTRGKLIVETKREWSQVAAASSNSNQRQTRSQDRTARQNRCSYAGKVAQSANDENENLTAKKRDFDDDNVKKAVADLETFLQQESVNWSAKSSTKYSSENNGSSVYSSGFSRHFQPPRRSDSTLSLATNASSASTAGRNGGGAMDDDDQALLDGLVKATTSNFTSEQQNHQWREKRRAKIVNRKSMRRTRTLKSNDQDLETAVKMANNAGQSGQYSQHYG